MKLSILICTLPDRRHHLNNLMQNLTLQNKHGVIIIPNDEGRNIPTGTKRNKLIDASNSDYFCFIDDDDQVPPYYIDELIKAIEQRPDVITFNGYMTTNGINRENFTIKLGEKYEKRGGHYYRFPNHICCFRRDAVRSVRFEPIWVQEDYRWAKQIYDRRLLKTEVHIDKDMYYYQYISNKPVYRR